MNNEQEKLAAANRCLDAVLELARSGTESRSQSPAYHAVEKLLKQLAAERETAAKKVSN